MQNNVERARIFHPFAALKGYEEALREIERIVENRKDLSNDDKDVLDNKIKNIKIGDMVSVKYYYGFEYIETIGIFKGIDKICKQIQVLNSKIDFDDILDINII